MSLGAPLVQPRLDPQLDSVQRLCGEIEGLARAARRGPAPTESVSYAPALFAEPAAAFGELIDTVQRLLNDLKPEATIRTTLDGESATTVVTYTSLAVSVWSANPSAQLVDSQLRSVQRVFAVRSAAARAVVAAGSAMVALSASVANPLALAHALSTAKSLQEALQRLVSAAEAAT